MSDRAPPTVEELLAHREWLRAVARSLVLDENAVDDAEQRTWVTVLRNRGPVRSVRGWLRRVVRSAVADERRSAARRHAREERAARPEGSVPSAEHLVAEAEAQRALAAAVTALPEPYRVTVLLRYFEGLAPTEIAAARGEPVETVKTRLRRALALLRAALDRDHGGDGRSWAIALVPLARLRDASWVPVGTGGLVMAATTKTIAASVAVGVLLGALATSGVTTLLAGRRADPDAAPAHAAATAQVTRDDGSRRATPAAPDDATPGAARVAAAREPDVAAVIDSIPVDVPRPGTGTIRGRVLAHDGKPLAGVRVWAYPPRHHGQRWRRGRATTTPSVEEALRAAVQDARWRAATERHAVTDDAGAYVLTGVTDLPHWIGASREGWEFRLVNVADSSNVRAGDTVDFAASFVIQVPVTVLLPDGGSPERAVVRWTSPRGSVNGTWFRDDPVMGLDPGAWSLAAELGTDLRSAPVPVTFAVDTAPAPVTLQLAWRNVIEGAVRFAPEDAGWDYVQVTARRRDANGAEGRTFTAAARPPGWQFRIEDLTAGEYELTAALDGSSPVAKATVRVSAGRVAQDLVVPRLSPAQFVTVRVLGPDGAPLGLEAFSLSIVEQRAGGGYAKSGSRPVRQEDGSFRVLLRPSQTTGERSDWFVRAESKTWGRRDAPFVPGESATADICFAEPARMRATIVGGDEASFRDRLRVTLRPRSAEGPDLLGARDEDASAPVEPGDYEAIVWIAEPRGPGGQIVARERVRLAPGENPVTLRVPPLHTLTVRLPDGRAGTKVYLSTARRPDRAAYTRSAVTSEGGTASFDDLPAGLHVVEAWLGGERSDMVVRVPASGEVPFVATYLAGLAVTIDDPSGSFGAAGFCTGDLIVVLDGTPVDAMSQVDALLAGARGHDRMEIELLRGRGSVTLTVDPAKFTLPGHRGGWWEPVVR